jgi:hypothetical protein
MLDAVVLTSRASNLTHLNCVSLAPLLKENIVLHRGILEQEPDPELLTRVNSMTVQYHMLQHRIRAGV